MCGCRQHGRSGAMRIPPKLGLNWGGVTQEDKNLQYLRNGARGPRLGLLLQTNRKSYTRFRLIPTSIGTLDDLERRIQGLLKVFTYPLLSQERVKLRTSSLARIFTVFIRTKDH